MGLSHRASLPREHPPLLLAREHFLLFFIFFFRYLPLGKALVQDVETFVLPRHSPAATCAAIRRSSVLDHLEDEYNEDDPQYRVEEVEESKVHSV